MKRLILAASLFIVGPAQEPVEQTCKVDAKLLIEMLAEYNVEHQSQIAAGEYWGLTNYNDKKVWISDQPDFTLRKEVVIHEAKHYCFHTRGIELPHDLEEEIVKAAAHEDYKAIFAQ